MIIYCVTPSPAHYLYQHYICLVIINADMPPVQISQMSYTGTQRLPAANDIQWIIAILMPCMDPIFIEKEGRSCSTLHICLHPHTGFRINVVPSNQWEECLSYWWRNNCECAHWLLPGTNLTTPISNPHPSGRLLYTGTCSYIPKTFLFTLSELLNTFKICITEDRGESVLESESEM